MKQLDILKKHFSIKATISNIEAQNLYRIRALPRRIKDLEEFHSFQFKRHVKSDITGQRYTRYEIVSPA